MNSLQRKITPKWARTFGITVLITVWILLTLDILWPEISDLRYPSAKPKWPEPDGVNYLVIAPPALQKSALAWADFRKSTGYQTQIVLLDPTQAEAEEIRNLIQETYSESGQPYPFYVLLVGHAHRYSSHPNTYLPTTHFYVDPEQSSGYGTNLIASDDGYSSVSSNGIPDHLLPIFIGRIPVRTEDEGFLLLERTRTYEEKPPTGEGRARIELISSNAGFGSHYDPIFDWALKTLIQKLLPAEYQWHLLNGNAKSPYSYPIYSFPNEVARRLDSAALAMVYIGHGQPDMLCCTFSPEGQAGRIFSFEDANLIQNANASLGIFTACSAGQYDLDGDDLSVIESIFLTPGGPVATYSSSAWINGGLNGRLVVDIFEALLTDRVSTMGEWVAQIESWSESRGSRLLFTEVVKVIIPRLSGMYENEHLLSKTQANQELDIQHATYNLFGDPALRIRYAQQEIEISPSWLWQPWKGSLAFSGKSELPAGQEVSISFEALPGELTSRDDHSIGTIDGYLQANYPVIGTMIAHTEQNGNFAGRMIVPPNTPSGKYLLRVVAFEGEYTYAAAHPVYIGLPPIMEMLSSAVFWWFFIGLLLLSKSRHRVQ